MACTHLLKREDNVTNLWVFKDFLFLFSIVKGAQ